MNRCVLVRLGVDVYYRIMPAGRRVISHQLDQIMSAIGFIIFRFNLKLEFNNEHSVFQQQCSALCLILHSLWKLFEKLWCLKPKEKLKISDTS